MSRRLDDLIDDTLTDAELDALLDAEIGVSPDTAAYMNALARDPGRPAREFGAQFAAIFGGGHE